MTTAAFFRFGSETFFVQGVKSAKYPYTVKPNPDEAAPTPDNADLLFTSSQMDSLKDRVTVNSKTPNVEIVDKFFRLEFKDKERRELALKTWGDLQWKCKAIGFGSGFVAVSLTLIAWHGPPAYIIVALYVGIVASTCLAGWSLHRYHVADKELTVWQRPGEDFAQKRKAALGLSLQEMIQEKCHFHPKQPTGMLFAVEILSVFKRDFKQFATPLLARKCDTPALQHQWVLDFFKGNPFVIKFFEGNPHLAKEAEWKDVQKFQTQFDLLSKFMKTLKESYAAQFDTNQKAAQEKQDSIKKNFEDKTKAFFEGQKLVYLRAQLYRSRVAPILNEECFSKINALYLRHKEQADYACSVIYLQVRTLLEAAQKALLEEQPYTLDEAAFADPAKFIPKNFQEELDAITASYQQNVITRAKAIDPLPLYHRFVDAAFA